jgi:fatty acid amide hydrolase
MNQHTANGPTTMSATEIAAAIRDRALSVREVVDAHIDRIEQVDPALNAVIWPLFDQARAAAGAADDLPPAAPEREGLLFGVPLTLKDQFVVDGTPTSLGLDHRSDAPLDGEGPLIGRLREQGAVFLGKTNLPQLLISHECLHARYGAANNPWDTARTPGGSSGGEGAIIAAGGSPAGLGGDMGGSIRVPAHFCGIHGLKPTGHRFPNDDSPLHLMGGLGGFEGFAVQPGPLARSVDDLKLLMDSLLGAPLNARDLSPPVPWHTGPLAALPAGLRVGVYTDDGFFTPGPAIRRLTHEAADALAAVGAEVVRFTPPDIGEASRIYLSLLCADGGAWIKAALAGEPPIADVKSMMKAGGLPNLLRGPLAGLLRRSGQHHTARMLSTSGRCDACHYWRLTAERTAYRTRFMDALDAAGIDLLVGPPHGLVAPLHDSNRNGLEGVAASYPALFNLLDLPAGVVAAGRVRPGEESDRTPSRDKVEADAARVEQGSAGLPVGVQIAARHWRDELVLAAMKLLETHFRDTDDYPTRAPI